MSACISIEQEFFRSLIAMRRPECVDFHDRCLIEHRLNKARRQAKVPALRQRATMLLAQRGYLPDGPRSAA